MEEGQLYSGVESWRIFTSKVRMLVTCEDVPGFPLVEVRCAVVYAFFSIAFLCDWNENTISNPVATAEFSKFAGILSAALSQHHLSRFEIVRLQFHHLH